MKKKDKTIRALVLFSGGLDSLLVAKLLQEQNIEVTGLTFESLFFNAQQARQSAKQINLPLKIIDISKELLKIIRNPQHGYGKNMNPCIDCHLLMLKKPRRL